MKVETIEYKGVDIQIYTEDYPENPRSWEPLGTMSCCHSKYKLGDLQVKCVGSHLFDLALEFWDGEDDSERDIILQKHYTLLPLYLYDHSGLSMSTKPFQDVWDSGKVGFIYCSLKDAQNSVMLSQEDREKGWDCLVSDWRNPKGDKVTLRSMVEYALEGEVEVYNYYISGQVYGWSALGDSCFGYYGSDFENNGLLAAARSSVDWQLSQRKQMVCEYCGSKEVVRDATAKWDPTKQEWRMVSVQDNSVCESCGEEDCIIERTENENT